MKMIQSLSREFIISFLLGILPIFFMYFNGGESSVLEMIRLINPSDFNVYYALILAAVYIGLCMIKRFIFIKKKGIEKGVAFLELVFSEVGNGVNGMFRLIAGVMMIMPALWFFLESNTFDIRISVICFFVGFFILFLNKILTDFYQWLSAGSD